MKILLKILVAPFALALSLLAALLVFLFDICAFLLTIASVILAVLGIALFFTPTNKLKALTGYAPADYIRMIRLQHAAQLLKQGEHTVTEIADMVGFSDAKYFREVFKKYYNVSPSKFNKKSEN